MKDQQQSKYQLSPYRFVNLLLFIFAAIVNSLPSQTFASISTLIEERFEYSPAIVTFMILLSPIMHPLMALPSSWILDKFGIKIGCSIGGVFVVLGSWCRMLMDIKNPGWGIFSSLMIAIGNVFILNSPSAFALNWFNSQTVPLVIAATVLFNLLSNGFGASLGGFFLDKDQSTIEEVKHFFFLEAVIITIPFILFFIFFRNLPPTPPNKSAAQEKQNGKSKIAYKQLIKQLIKNTSYIKVIISMSFSYGTFISLASILDQALDYLQYQNSGKATSSTLFSALLAGSISAFFFTKIIKQTLKYKFIISMCLLGSFLTFILLETTFFLKIQNTYIILYMGACAGFFIIPLTALFTTYSAELTYPIPQASVTGYLFAGSQTIGFLLGMLWIFIMSKQHIWTVYLMFVTHTILIVISWFISLNTKQNLARSQFQVEDSPEVEQEAIAQFQNRQN